MSQNRNKLKVTGCVALTLVAITLFMVWIGAALLTVKSFWYTDTFSLLLLDRENELNEHRRFHFYDLSTNRGRFFVRVALRTDIDPFRHDFNVGWFHVRIRSPSRFAENVERLIQKYAGDQQQFLGFHWAAGHPSLKSSETQWLRFIKGPIWPFLLFFTILPAGLFLWRSRWPRERHTWSRVIREERRRGEE